MLDAGMQALAVIDPAMHASIQQDVASGTLAIGELVDGPNVADADGDTIAVKLSDRPSPGIVAARLLHEQVHRQNDAPGRPHFGEPVACAEARAYGQTYEALRIASCLGEAEGWTVPCANLNGVWRRAWDNCRRCIGCDWMQTVGLFDTGCCVDSP